MSTATVTPPTPQTPLAPDTTSSSGPTAPATMGGGTQDMEQQSPGSTQDLEARALQARTSPRPEPEQPEHHSWLGEILHAVGDVLGGPKTAKTVNPQTGAIEEVPLSRGQRIAHGIGTALVGAAAGAAQHGPGAVGKAALAGVQAQQEQQGINQRNLQAESQNVRATNEAAQQKQLVQASLAKSSQEQAAAAVNMKESKLRLNDLQTKIANELMTVANAPGVKELTSFDTNDEINQHLEDVGPQIAKQYAVDMARNNVRIIQGADGRAHAFQVPKGFGELPIGEGKSQLAVEPGKDGKLTVVSHPADPRATYDQWMSSNLAARSAVDSQQEAQAKIEHEKAGTELEKQEKQTGIATQKHTEAETKLLGSFDNAKNIGGEPITLQPGQTPVEHVKEQKDFNKSYVDPLVALQKSQSEFHRIETDPKMTPAEKVTGLLSAVGISFDPLKGKGARVNQSVIGEHAEARDIYQGALAKLDKLRPGGGGPITEQQIHDYAAIARGVVSDAQIAAARESRRRGFNPDFLPKGQTGSDGRPQVVDADTAKTYLAAFDGDVQKAHNALVAQGFAP